MDGIMSNTALAKTFVWSWFVLCLTLLTVCLALYLKPHTIDSPHQRELDNSSISSTVAAPASTTEIVDLSTVIAVDCDLEMTQGVATSASVRHCFDQLLQTKQPIGALNQALERGLTANLSPQIQQQLQQVWTQYTQYHAALLALSQAKDTEEHAFAIASLRQQHFNTAQRLGLFGAETPMIQFRLDQQQILHDSALTPVAKAEQLAQLFAQAPMPKQTLKPLQQDSLRQLQQELRLTHASAQDVEQVLSFLS
jgi:lipase chaperone LimK